ncbi:MAG: CoA pyrophosphatase [Pseudomonadota bacterium]
MAYTELNQDLRTTIQRNLAGFEHLAIDGPGLRRAAVAITITATADGPPAVLLTRRPARMGRHAGQYALPGGRVDDGETLEEAARRELEEELGVALAAGAVIGRLDDYPTRSGFSITPFVLWGGRDLELTPAADEVAKVFHIPLDELDSDALPHFEEGEQGGHPVLYSMLPTLGHSMYSPTASVLYQFREVALRGLSTRVAHYDQPRFAWK